MVKGNKILRAASFLLCFSLAMGVFASSAYACSWAEYSDGKTSMVVRTMDWWDDTLEVRGYGREVSLKSADTDNAIAYDTKYASIVMQSLGVAVGDAMNEKGLQGSCLLLEESYYPDPDPDKKDVDPLTFLLWAVSNYETVNELVRELENINLLPIVLPQLSDLIEGDEVTDPHKFPVHYAFSDATGDNLIIEMIDGEMTLYHGNEHDVLVNDPPYDKLWYMFNDMHYKAHATIETWDRFIAAKQYLRDMKERGVTGNSHIFLAMRGLEKEYDAGTDQMDRTYNNRTYPTVWSTIADQENKVYYLSRYNRLATEIYDFSSFDVTKAEMVTLEPTYNTDLLDGIIEQ